MKINMNRYVIALAILMLPPVAEAVDKKLHAKYPHQDKSTSSPKEKALNEYMAREEMLFNISSCICNYRGKKARSCTSCPESKMNKAREFVVIYYA